jgi:hypothetical protein
MLLSKVFIRNLLVPFILVLTNVSVFGQDTDVCITRTGSKYHRCTCSYLRSSSIDVSLSEAIENGYTACSVCRPPTTASHSKQQPVRSPSHADSTVVQRSTQPYKPVQRTTGSTQCTATTKAGSRCKRMTTESNGRCWQHQ